MKIIKEKISSVPDHSVSRKDIEIVIRHIPKDWVGVANIFKISSQLFNNSKWDRPVIENNATFLIMSRGFERNYIIKELLVELAIRPSGLGYSMKAHHLNKEQRNKLEKLICPLYEAITTELK